MRKIVLCIVICLNYFVLKSQTVNQHIIGVNFDYAHLPKIFDAKFGGNFTYIFARKHFFSRIEIGTTPISNFGSLTKTTFGFGATSNINQPISFHLFSGLGGMVVSDSYRLNGKDYDAEIGNAFADIGTLVRPFKNDAIYFGFDFMVSGYSIYPKGYHNLYEETKGLVYFIDFSFNYKINRVKKSPSSENNNSTN